MFLVEIKANTPQPFDCPKCKGKYGYKVIQRIQKYIDLIYDESGNNEGCVYSEHEKVLTTLKRSYCANCNAPLPFSVKM